MRVTVRLITALAACLALLGAGGPALAAEPIGPGQYFVGIVNGSTPSSTTVPVVYTVCPGPIWLGRTGSVLGGQSLAVTRVRSGGGYTGWFSSINAWIAQDVSKGGAPQQVRFTTYDTELPFPDGAQVPCDGSGQVVFSSCPYLAPCAYGWVPFRVPVRFVNVAA